MKPVDQTDFGPETGNCFAASIASIMEIPLADVPNLDPNNWFDEFNKWLYDYGYFAMYFSNLRNKADRDELEHITNNVICEASVESPRFPGVMHSVVFHKGAVIHDPHPDKTSMSAKLEDLRSLIVFVDINPIYRKR